MSAAARAELLDPAATLLLDAVEEWVRDQRVEDILPEEKLRGLIRAVRSDASFWERQHFQYERLWAQIEAELRLETRSLREVLGEDMAAEVAGMVEKYDSRALVRSVLESDAMEKLLGSVLYEALFAFVNSVDILGQMMSNLPIIGPMRAQIIQQSKKQVDALLGDQISTFLGGYTSEAVGSAVKYTETHGRDIRRTQRKLTDKVLDQPFNSLLPPDVEMAFIRQSLWIRVRHFRLPGEDDIIRNLYAEFGTETIDTLMPIQDPRTKQARPRIFVKARDILAQNLHGFITSESGRKCLAELRTLEGDGTNAVARNGAHGADSAAAPSAKPKDEGGGNEGGGGGDATDAAGAPSASTDDDWD